MAANPEAGGDWCAAAAAAAVGGITLLEELPQSGPSDERLLSGVEAAPSGPCEG